MSYEGYEVYYCVNGHKQGCFDCSDFIEESDLSPCHVCGSTDFLRDSCDQTNGCQCVEWVFPEMFADFKGGVADLSSVQRKEMGRSCGGHEEVDTVVGWSPFVCSECGGSGGTELVIEWVAEPCRFCKGVNPTCRECNGTRVTMRPAKRVSAGCPVCRGRGKMFAEIWDVSRLANVGRVTE